MNPTGSPVRSGSVHFPFPTVLVQASTSSILTSRISLSSGLMRQFQSVRHRQANSCKLNAPNYTRMARIDRTKLFTLYARDSIFVKWNTPRTHVLKLKTFFTPFHRPALSLLLPSLVSGPSSPRPVSKSTSPPPSSNALQYRPQSVSHIESRKYAGIRIYRPSPCCTDSVDGSRCCGDSISCASSIDCHVRVLVVSAGNLWTQDSGTPHNIVP